MAEEEQQELKTYRGNCHCGAFVYEAEAPEITAAGDCNCSYCYKKGYFYVFASPDRFKIVKGNEDTLRLYTFGHHRVLHKFCPTCSSGIVAENLDHPLHKRIAFNVHTVQDIDQWSLKRLYTDNTNVGVPYTQPTHKGGLPSGEVENGRIYKGGCHCGAVTVAMASKPLDETYNDMLVECNCSMCERIGGVWAYPTTDQVVVSADEDKIGYYVVGIGLGFMRKSFCKMCGINIGNSWNPDFTQEQFDALPEGVKQYAEGGKTRHPMNLRIFPDVDLSKLTIRKNDGRAMTPPEYVNP